MEYVVGGGVNGEERQAVTVAAAAQSGGGFDKKKMHVRDTYRAFGRRLKEKRSRFYIIRRCISILVCWHRHHQSDRNP
ncbi:hypothetical protein SAY87_019322 [Trapa incisa]|uniref:Uncharacterized protein n=1 Tax=Trapa incisa TaxID=236973 RepID=A0AAN7K1E5_9MYRT|nr:hypothetical protein SAY87_019322 [Trapa incisa]